MLRFWSIGLVRRGWNSMLTLKNLSLLMQLRHMYLKELLDKGVNANDTVSRTISA